jgi:hypothetical protein
MFHKSQNPDITWSAPQWILKADLRCLKKSIIKHGYITIPSISNADEIFGRYRADRR